GIGYTIRSPRSQWTRCPPTRHVWPPLPCSCLSEGWWWAGGRSLRRGAGHESPLTVANRQASNRPAPSCMFSNRRRPLTGARQYRSRALSALLGRGGLRVQELGVAALTTAY